MGERGLSRVGRPARRWTPGAAARQRENAGSAANSEMHARSKSSHGKIEQHSSAQHSTTQCTAMQHSKARGGVDVWMCHLLAPTFCQPHPRPAIFSPSLLSPSPSALAPSLCTAGLITHAYNPRPSHLGPLGPFSIEPIGHLSPDRSPLFASAPCHLRRPPAADSWRGLFVRGLRR